MAAENKNIDTKNPMYHFVNDMINFEEFDSYQDIDIYYVGYITIKKSMIMKIFTA